MPDIDEEAFQAAADLVGRTGARSLEFGYLHDDVPMHEADWWASVQYNGAKVIAEHHRDPIAALEALCQRLLTGGQCQRCGGLVSLSDDGAVAYPGAARPDGTVWTEAEIRAAGHCRWRREGKRWEPGCGLPPAGTRYQPERGDTVHTTEKLALALEAAERDVELRTMIVRARQGYYHDYLSPLALPEMQLVADLEERGHPELAQRVRDGEFDASKAESDAWMCSEGKDIFEEFFANQPIPQPGPNRAERRAAFKKFRRKKR